MADELNLSNLKPAQPRRGRKRIGRGLGSGKGRYSGRGLKGQKARSGSHKMRAGFEGGQMPLYMRIGKQRGSTSADAMPIGPHRTYTVPVNLRDLERVFADGDTVNLEILVERGLIKNTKTDVKILANGELTKKLSVTAHRFSETAREKIEAAGGTATALREDADARKKRPKAKKSPSEAVAEPAAAAGDEPEVEAPEAEAPEAETPEAETEE